MGMRRERIVVVPAFGSMLRILETSRYRSDIESAYARDPTARSKPRAKIPAERFMSERKYTMVFIRILYRLDLPSIRGKRGRK
jgi:hypothetical protein